MPAAKFRITVPTVVLFVEENGARVARTLDAGSIITASLSSLNVRDEMIPVTWEERTILIFPEDIQAAGQRLEGSLPPKCLA